MSNEARVPSLPAVTPNNLTEFARAVKQVIDVREGLVGSGLDANVTFRDLVDVGAVALRPGWTERSSSSRNSGPPVIPSWADPDGYDPSTDLTPPPAPEGVTATGLFALVQIQWNEAPNRNHSYAEIWRNDVNVLGNATMIGTATGTFYTDSLGANATRYYWVRFVSKANIFGPYNATNGTVAQTATDPDLVLSSLSNQIRESHLYSDLTARINLIDDAETGLVKKTSDLIATYGSTASAAQSSAAAIAAKTAAILAQGAAELAEGNAKSYATSASQSKVAAETAKSAASVHEANAAASATTATGAAATATSEKNLAVSAKGAAESAASAALGYRDTASTHATSAGTSAATATSEKNLAISAKNAAEAASTATIGYRDTASTHATNAGTSASSAESAKNLAVSAKTAAESASAATIGYRDTAISKAGEASGSASAAAISLKQLQATATGFDAAYAWNFDASVDGFTSSGASISIVDGALRVTASGGDPIVYTPSIVLSGSKNRLIRARIKRIAGTGWQGQVYYQTDAHGDSESYTKSVPNITSTTEWVVVEWDMSSLSAGGTDWASSTIKKLRLDLGSSASDVFDIDWVTVGSISPVAYTALLQAEAKVRSDTDGSLGAQYTIKTDLAGRVAGFGLASEATAAGANTSVLAVVADRFYVAAPNDYAQDSTPTTGVTAGKVWFNTSTKQTLRYDTSLGWVAFNPMIPFAVQTTATTINDVVVPAGVYMDSAFIRDGTIARAKIGFLAVDDSKIASLDAAKITTGYLDANRIDARSITADKIGGGEISASVSITVGGSGEGAPLVLSGAGEVISNGPNGDKARLYYGNVEIYKTVPSVGSVVYKALSRVEFGQAVNGSIVTIPGYFRSQPKIIVSPANMQLFSAAYGNQDQSIQCEARDIVESSSGSMVWSFKALATLGLSANSGSTVINQPSDAVTGSWTSPQYTTAANAVSISPSVTLASFRGTGTSGGYYKRSVRWRVEYLVSGNFVVGPWTTSDLPSAVDASITSTATFTFPSSGTWVFRIYAEAYDTGGTFSTGTQYETTQVSRSRSDPYTIATSNGSQSVEYRPYYLPPTGWEVYGVIFTYSFSYTIGASGNFARASGGGGSFSQSAAGGSGTSQSYSAGPLTQTHSATTNSLIFSVSATPGAGSAIARIELFSASSTISIRRPLTNSTAATNRFTFNNYGFNLTSAQVLATGSLSWVAVGD